jgi:endonuclease YncB( thermonuclease family)
VGAYGSLRVTLLCLCLCHARAQIRDPALKAAVEALADAEDDARRAHRGIWEHGDPGDSDDEEPAPRAPAWGKKK